LDGRSDERKYGQHRQHDRHQNKNHFHFRTSLVLSTIRHGRTIILDEMQRLGDAAQILKIATDDLVRQDSQRNLDLHDCRAPYPRHLGSAAKGFCALVRIDTAVVGFSASESSTMLTGTNEPA